MGSSKYPTLGFDPAPGDLETVRLMVKAIGRVNRESGTAQTQLGRIGTSDGIWDGKAADTFVKSVDKIPPYLKRALDSLGSAHRALAAWETSLDRFQTRARALEEEAVAAAKKVSTAKGALDGLPDDTSGMSDEEKEKHDKSAKDKRRAYETADGELEAVRSRARTLHSEYVTAADTTARALKDAADDAPPEPGWFDDLVDGLTEFLSDAWDTITDPDFWKLVGDLLADIAMVIGVVCLVAMLLGTGVGALGLIGFLVGLGALAAHGAAMAGGAEGVTGVGLAAGSNANDSRWTDGDWNVSDIPVVGPIAGFAAYEPPDDEPATLAPGPLGTRFDPAGTLTSAGDSISRHLGQSDLGTAA